MNYIKENDKTKIFNGNFNGEAAIIILINKESKVLMQHRDNIPTIIHPNLWTVPGGIKDDIDKSPLDTAYREVKEEIGYIPDSLKLFGQTIDSQGRNELIHIYHGSIDKELSELVLTEGQGMNYFSKNELMGIEIIPFVKVVLERFFDTI